MHANELQEMEWLASQLATTAGRLTRAVALLRNNADLERAEARIAVIAAAKPAQATAAAPPKLQPGGVDHRDRRSLTAAPGRPADQPAKLKSGTFAEQASGGFAVFDAGGLERRELALNSAGKLPRLGDEVPF